MFNFLENNKGNSILIILLILSAFLVATLGISNLILSGLKMGRISENSVTAYYAAETGAERSLWEIRKHSDIVPENDLDNIYVVSDLGNGSYYNVNFSRQDTDVYYSSIGSYEDIKRSIEISFYNEISVPLVCIPVCDGTCSPNDTCGSFCSGSCTDAGDVCLGGFCVAILVEIITISSCQELQGIGGTTGGLGDNYILAQDIDCGPDTSEGGALWNGGLGFDPIGEGGSKFTGTFNGSNHVISNLYISRSGEDNVGLFGTILGAEISNLGLMNNQTSGKNSVGGLVGFNNESSIVNSYVTGGVSGSDGNVGGLVGRNGVFGALNNSLIIDSYFIGDINGGFSAGGLVGVNHNSSIENSYSIGNVSGETNVGGLVGFNYEDSFIINSYTISSVSGDSRVGGLVGYNKSEASIENSYAVGDVGGDSRVGGLVGYNYSDSFIEFSYWNTETSGLVDGCGSGVCVGAEEKNTADMVQELTYQPEWDFVEDNDPDNIWKINNYVSYPCLNWQTGNCPTPTP